MDTGRVRSVEQHVDGEDIEAGPQLALDGGVVKGLPIDAGEVIK